MYMIGRLDHFVSLFTTKKHVLFGLLTLSAPECNRTGTLCGPMTDFSVIKKNFKFRARNLVGLAPWVNFSNQERELSIVHSCTRVSWSFGNV